MSSTFQPGNDASFDSSVPLYTNPADQSDSELGSYLESDPFQDLKFDSEPLEYGLSAEQADELDNLSDEELAAKLAELDEPPFDATDFFLVLFVAGIPGLIVGFGAGLLCAGFAVLINVFHNLLPAYFFVMPLFVVFFMAISPAVYGLGVGTGVGYVAHLLKAPNPGSAAFAGLFWGLAGLFVFPYVAEYGTPEGTIFFDDVLMPYVNNMVGAALHFEWLTKPEPANISPGIVKTVWWIAGGLGVLLAIGRAFEVVEDEPTDEEVIVDL